MGKNKKNNLNTLKKNTHHTDGYVTLVLVIIIGVLAFAIALSAITDGVSASKSGFSFMQSYEARSYANACAEEVLYKIHSGTISLGTSDSTSEVFSNGSCSASTNVNALGAITMSVSGVALRAKTDITITGTVSGGKVTITAWQ